MSSFFPKAVVFDMDGLMFDTEAIAKKVWFEISAARNLACDDAFFLKFIGRRSQDSLKLLHEAYGADFPAEIFQREVSDGIKGWIAAHGAPQKPGLPELLARIDFLKLPRAVATSTRRDGAVKTLGAFASGFQAIVTGDEVTHGKPAPDIFLLAAKRLGVDPAECLALEDSELGVASAAAAGMKTIMVPDLIHPGEETLTRAWRILASLHEVQEHVFPG
jgi:HAD superfamily hydrolase (TIGR01509 family)